MSDNRTVKIIISIGLLLLVAMLAAIGYGGWRLYKGLKWVEEQNAKADDLPTLEELIGPPIPDEENAAIVYQQAFDAFDLTDEDKDILYGERAPDHPGHHIHDLPKLQAVVAKNERALALLEKAAAMPKCRFPIDWSDPINAKFLHLAHLRSAARLEAGKAIVLASQGRLQGALDAAATCFHFGEDAKKGAPVLISFLVEVAIDNIALHAAEAIVDQAVCPPQASARLSARLRQTDMVALYIQALKGERAFGLLLIEQMPETMRRELEKPGEISPGRILQGLSPLNWAIEGSRAWYAKFMKDYIELAPLPYRRSRQKLAHLEAEIERIPPPYRMVCAIFLPVLPGAVAKRDRARAQIEMCIVALDLKVYKHEQGAYPEKLDELPEASEQGYAEDVFSGKRFKYRRNGEGFLLYSLGRDLDDDGGAPLGRMVNGKPEWEDGDLVWRCSK